MEEKQKKILQWVFTGIMGVGLVLIIVGMFLGFVHSDTLKITYKLTSDNEWKMTEAMVKLTDGEFSASSFSSTFCVISFVVAIVGTAWLIVNSVLKNVLHKSIKRLWIVAGTLAFAGALLIIFAGIALANNLDKLYNYGSTVEVSFFSPGAGIYLGLVGGILATVAAIVSGLKAFNN